MQLRRGMYNAEEKFVDTALRSAAVSNEAGLKSALFTLLKAAKFLCITSYHCINCGRTKNGIPAFTAFLQSTIGFIIG